MLQVASTFVEPYAQPALGGQDGLTSEDIAKSLSARHDNVVAAIQDFLQIDQAFTASQEKILTKGRPKILWVLPTFEAKMLVAQYKSKAGIAYVRFLLACERIVLEAVPKLQEKIAEQTARIAQLEAKALPKPKVSTIDVPQEIEGLWGKTEGGKRCKVRADTVPKLQLLTYKSSHLGRVVEGCGKAQQKTAREIQKIVTSAAIKAQDGLFPLLPSSQPTP